MLKHFLLALTFFGFSAAYAQDAAPNLNIIPAPVSLKKSDGVFILNQETLIQADTPANRAVGVFTSALLSTRGLRKQVTLTDNSVTTHVIKFTSAGADALPAEGYHISITPQQITVTGKGAGLFYAVQTLIQLLPATNAAVAKVPCVDIDDYPRFGYRGLHLDVSRHFFGVDFVKKYIDLMAQYKLNTFHWHLTDDQGWRIEIKKYPKLTEVGSQREQTMIGNYHDFNPQQFDNTPYGGYYTQDQVRDVVKYAAERYITVLPEIEMPGHSVAAIAAYPELGCYGNKQVKVQGTWGGFDDIYCPTDYTFNFMQDVLTEVMGLFPSKYIHIGGDEVSKTAWKQSVFCQDLIKKLKLKDEEGLQSYFIQRIEKFVNSKGRSIIGWDEILQGGLAPNATVMSWRGESGGIAAAQQHHNVIMTPGSGGVYFDHAQGKTSQEPVGIGGYAPLQKTYSYNPVPVSLTTDQQKYIMGVQANVWTEYIATDNKVEYMLLPRLLALSEIAWTPLANKNYKDFSETRVPVHLAKIDAAGLNYRVSTAIGAPDTIITGNKYTFTLKSPVAGAKIYYTIDGYTPRETDLEYTGPVTVQVPDNMSRVFQTIVITPSGKRSAVTRAVINNKPALAPVTYSGTADGLKYRLFNGTFENTDKIDGGAEIDTGIVKNFNTNVFRKNGIHDFGVIYNGFIRIDNDGRYSFSTSSGDGSVLLIDDQLVVDNDGKHSAFEQGGDVLLQKGYHKFTLKYFFASAGNSLHVYMTIPGKPKGELPPDMMFN
ncbi:beta-N-acetylhexosaminidase [Mucilaginibacter sp. PPCGB 2223]|uniref:family 20 glycosylhydrolase n=1 Tax=Mucilaginibacter sp. PPCGB 2223 TaxID=1886027 RepID=UPI0008248F8A|nr:family 20 glycosylhydrolase [Mucilaginibacter sp. PPCGB 2223]OCX52628.1 beta-N-acetylhexosaminidase [Mucilaginibacter sp. PPCGB 2223]